MGLHFLGVSKLSEVAKKVVKVDSQNFVSYEDLLISTDIEVKK